METPTSQTVDKSAESLRELCELLKGTHNFGRMFEIQLLKDLAASNQKPQTGVEKKLVALKKDGMAQLKRLRDEVIPGSEEVVQLLRVILEIITSTPFQQFIANMLGSFDDVQTCRQQAKGIIEKCVESLTQVEGLGEQLQSVLAEVHCDEGNTKVSKDCKAASEATSKMAALIVRMYGATTLYAKPLMPAVGLIRGLIAAVGGALSWLFGGLLGALRRFLGTRNTKHLREQVAREAPVTDDVEQGLLPATRFLLKLCQGIRKFFESLDDDLEMIIMHVTDSLKTDGDAESRPSLNQSLYQALNQQQGELDCLCLNYLLAVNRVRMRLLEVEL